MASRNYGARFGGALHGALHWALLGALRNYGAHFAEALHGALHGARKNYGARFTGHFMHCFMGHSKIAPETAFRWAPTIPSKADCAFQVPRVPRLTHTTWGKHQGWGREEGGGRREEMCETDLANICQIWKQNLFRIWSPLLCAGARLFPFQTSVLRLGDWMWFIAH